jgi:hypothetical protein
MPMLIVGLKAIALYNGAAGIAQCLGYPVPKIPRIVSDYAHGAVGVLEADSSVAEFDVLQAAVDNTHVAGDPKSEEAKAVRGKALRELQVFLNEHDPSKSFCGLQRVLTKEGACIWTTEENLEDVMNGKGRTSIGEEDMKSAWDVLPHITASEKTLPMRNSGSDPKDKERISNLIRDIHVKMELKKKDRELHDIARQKDEDTGSKLKLVKELQIKLDDRDKKLKEHDKKVQEKEKKLEERAKWIYEKDKQLIEKDKLLSEKDHVILEISTAVTKLSKATLALSHPSGGCCGTVAASVIPTSDVDTNAVVQALMSMKR